MSGFPTADPNVAAPSADEPLRSSAPQRTPLYEPYVPWPHMVAPGDALPHHDSVPQYNFQPLNTPLHSNVPSTPLHSNAEYSSNDHSCNTVHNDPRSNAQFDEQSIQQYNRFSMQVAFIRVFKQELAAQIKQTPARACVRAGSP